MARPALWKVVKPIDDTITDPVCRFILTTWRNGKALAYITYVARKQQVSRHSVRRRMKKLEKLGYLERYR